MPSTYLGLVIVTKNNGMITDDEDDGEIVTPLNVIDSLTRHTIRPNGAYTRAENFCGICYRKYNIGDRTISLPCQHNFHDYCIENWLKWVKSTCPVDKKSVIRSQYRETRINERRVQLLEAYNLNDSIRTIFQDSSSDEKQKFNSSDSDEIISSGITRSKILRKTRPYKKVLEQQSKTEESDPKTLKAEPIIQEAESSRDFSPKRILPFGIESDKQTDVSSNSLTKNSETSTSKTGLTTSYKEAKIAFRDFQRLRKSVEDIRKSLEKSKSTKRKSHNSSKYLAALNDTTVKLSRSKIQSHQVVPNTSNKNRNQRNSLMPTSPTKSKMTSDCFYRSPRIILNKRNLTFRDLLDIEEEETSAKTSVLPTDIPIKYDRLVRKKL